MRTPLFWSNPYRELQRGSLAIAEFKSSDHRTLFPYVYAQGILSSPGVGTFGGFWPPSISLETLDSAFSSLMIDAKFSSGIIECNLRFPPSIFCENSFQQQIDYFLDGFSSHMIIDTNQYIDIESWSLADLSHGNRKKMNQFGRSHGVIEKTNIESDYILCYNLLADNRKKRNVIMSMSLERVIAALSKMPDTYRCYKATIENEIIACAITVDLDVGYRYVLYWGDSPTKRNLSPVTSLCEFLVIECRKENIQVLDLGISSQLGTLDDGLFRYKRNLGASESSKITLSFIP